MSEVKELHFCGLEPSDCGYRIPINMVEHDKQVRAEVLNEAFSKINKLTAYYAGDKDGNAITPKMLIKKDVIKLLEQLKEQNK